MMTLNMSQSIQPKAGILKQAFTGLLGVVWLMSSPLIALSAETPARPVQAGQALNAPTLPQPAVLASKEPQPLLQKLIQQKIEPQKLTTESSPSAPLSTALNSPDSTDSTQDMPLSPGDSIDLQDSVMGTLVKGGTILSDGSLTLPLLGRVTLAGKSLTQARTELTGEYQRYFNDPRLSLRVARRHPVRIYLTGAVAHPGVYISGKNLNPDTLKAQMQLGGFNQQFHFYRLYLADALILAGGLNYNANVRDVIIHRHQPQPDTLHINLLELFQGGDTLKDIALHDHDVIEVPTIADNTLVLDDTSAAFQQSNLATAEFKISVIGAVMKPGGYSARTADNVLTAIAKAGGFSPNANANRVYVLHATEQGQLIHRELNLQDKKLIGKQPIQDWASLLPNDVIFVDESTGRKMAHYSRDLFLDRIAVAAMFPFFSRFFNKN